MNYLKIYEDLIESRKMQPKLENEYYERHHILPRCMGGTNENTNLVYLTAEDHFIAHLLLAKAYGGKLWYGVTAMMRSKSKFRLTNRHMVGAARRIVTLMGRDDTEHKFIELRTGEIISETQYGMRVRFGLSRTETSLLVSGKITYARGYCLANIDVMTRLNPNHIEVLSLKHVKTGEIFCGTRQEIYNLPKLCTQSVTRLTTMRTVESNGYIIHEWPAIPLWWRQLVATMTMRLST